MKAQAKKALWDIVKNTHIKDYKKTIQPNWAIVTDYIERTCKWGYDDEFEHSCFISECGFTFQFTDDRNSPNEYDFNFCPKCGGKIEEHIDE